MGKTRHIATLLVGFLASCVVESDPATPCGELDLGEAEPATVAAREHAPLVAVSVAQTDSPPFVLHYQCEDATELTCTLRKTTLAMSPGSALMITADGQWVVGVDRDNGTVTSWRSDPVEGLHESDARLIDAPRRLVASLRNSSWIIVRDHDGEAGNLARFSPELNKMEKIVDAELGLSVAAVGELYVIGRRIRGDGLEDLYLVPAHPDVNRFGKEPTRLIRSRPFSRVVLTPGDERVVATSGEGRSAETFVFSTSDGTLIDRFAGAAITGRRPLEDIPGMRAVSPDGSHVAYRTPSGAIALRNVDTQGACMVRGANAGEHTLAGFSAHGLLYIESETGIGRPHVHAFDPATRRLEVLDDADYTRGLRLAAIPGRHGDPSERPWAIGVSNGTYHAMQPDAPAVGLNMGQAVFMPRDDAAIWAVNTVRESAEQRSMTVRRIVPASTDRAYAFSTGAQADVVYTPDDGAPPATFSTNVRAKTCLSTGVPGSWGTQCGMVSSSSFLAGTSIPPAEDPYDSGARLEPELPALPNE